MGDFEDRVVVAGAGSVGCFVGGLLAASGRPVTLLGRAGPMDVVRHRGLRLTDVDGGDIHVSPGSVTAADDPAVLSTGALILVTVKGIATEEMAELIRTHASGDATVITLQNGVRNADRLRRVLANQHVLGGMVPFNIVERGEAHFHRGTGGAIVVERSGPGARSLAAVPGLPIVVSHDVDAVLWGKLIINLNNAVNAMSDLPLREELGRRKWRCLLADQMAEALATLKIADIVPTPPGKIPFGRLLWLLRLPDPIFRLLARSMLRIDEHARSSMWDDLQRGRPTEIDRIQGEIVRLAEFQGRAATHCAAAVAAIRALERRQRRLRQTPPSPNSPIAALPGPIPATADLDL